MWLHKIIKILHGKAPYTKSEDDWHTRENVYNLTTDKELTSLIYREFLKMEK